MFRYILPCGSQFKRESRSQFLSHAQTLVKMYCKMKPNNSAFQKLFFFFLTFLVKFAQADPDLEASSQTLQNSVFYDTVDTTAIDCNCLQGQGRRSVLRFSIQISNVGNSSAIFPAQPASQTETSSFWTWSQCRGVWFVCIYSRIMERWADITLRDNSGALVASSSKYGTCTYDFTCRSPLNPTTSCTSQGNLVYN